MTTAPSGVAAPTGGPAPFPLEFGIDTFGDRTSDEEGRLQTHSQTIRNVVEQGVLAEQVGVDFIGTGEHHTDDFPLSAADVVLAAIAARTTRIHVGSAVTVLSSDDPVRVFQRFSTLNAVSGGRAEVILGRGSSIDSFPLFGYDLVDCQGANRFDLKYGMPGLAQQALLTNIELYGTQVIPRVRELLA
jgi:alkanesulfonate monooxygenase SsuD/methylene tetrahydromethanopterin reductase-like flavin-dependent oxidoreductase (luciferase family)